MSPADCAKVEAPWRTSTPGQSMSEAAVTPACAVVSGAPTRKLLKRWLNELDEEEVAGAGPDGADATVDGREPNRLS